MHCEAHRPPAATEEVGVRVVAAEHALIERLLQAPDDCGDGSRGGGTKAARHTLRSMPEGDALHRAARRLQVLVGQELEVETPHPRAAVKQLAPRLDGRRLESVEAIGKNLLLHFEGGLVVRSHLRMKGRWRVFRRDAPIFGQPWLVLRGEEYVGAMFNGAVLELDRGVAQRLGPDILAEPPDFETMLRRLRAHDQGREVGDAVLDQRLVAGIGNLWKAESLWRARVSPWRRLADVSDSELRATLEEAHRLMRGRLDGVPGTGQVYRRKGRPCPRCGTAIRSWPQGDGARMAYWCPTCQRGEEPKTA
jgi:endonuclease-8